MEREGESVRIGGMKPYGVIAARVISIFFNLMRFNLMRTAILSDIHGNLEALKSVLEDLHTRNCDRIICLGDLVDGGFFNIEVIKLVQALKIPTIQGNHDALS